MTSSSYAGNPRFGYFGAHANGTVADSPPRLWGRNSATRRGGVARRDRRDDLSLERCRRFTAKVRCAAFWSANRSAIISSTASCATPRPA